MERLTKALETNNKDFLNKRNQLNSFQLKKAPRKNSAREGVRTSLRDLCEVLFLSYAGHVIIPSLSSKLHGSSVVKELKTKAFTEDLISIWYVVTLEKSVMSSLHQACLPLSINVQGNRKNVLAFSIVYYSVFLSHTTSCFVTF